jgi:hypothetical protein
MKNLLFTISLVFTTLIAFAQGNNLQFNAAKMYKINTANWRGSISITVPPNKTLKIESASAGLTSYGFPSTITTTSSNNNTISLFLDNSLIASPYSVVATGVVVSSSSGNSYICRPTPPTFPIWLPSGTYILGLLCSPYVSSSVRFYGFISGVEYNIVP